ncbi:MAG: ribosome small subunit-dependent GTPase A [Bacillota bacterium]|nr:ribosome small subunit-dependent GTPase A [Bacillota bacterium]
MPEGKILKGVSGSYTVKTDAGVLICKPRGIFRKDGITPLAGDNVIAQNLSETEGIIDEILPRKNALTRPPVANLDILFVIIAVEKPDPSPIVIDKLIALCEQNDIEPIICINKIDLKQECGLFEVYKKAGFHTFQTSAANCEGIDSIFSYISKKVCAFAGSSGVGKTSLLNCLGLKTSEGVGAVSAKTARGKHTTRHVELFELNDGFIADTPGFQDLSFESIQSVSKENVQFLFREFAPLIGNCRFHDCSHMNEPDCAVKKAVENGEVAVSRYESYTSLFTEIKNRRPSWG